MKRRPLFLVYVLAVACSFLAAAAGFWLLNSLTLLLLPLAVKKP